MRRIALLVPLAALLAYGCGGDSSSALDSPLDASAGGSAGNDGGTGTGGSAGTAGDSGGTAGSAGSLPQVPYPIVDTGQALCYGAQTAIECPAAGSAFFGQDAQFQGNQPDYTTSADGLTVRDNVTGLTWQRSPDTNGDGQLTADDKLEFAAAEARCSDINASKFGGFDDWRLPSIKELYSLIDFRGSDPSGFEGSDTSGLTPFIDSHFLFAYGQTSAGERIIDSQYASSTLYVNKSWMGYDQMFGVNFADGRIKGYDLMMPGGKAKTFFVQCVRGNAAYGVNSFVDNGDQTITDQATGLMWSMDDSGEAMDYQTALAWVQNKNAEKYLGHDDWRMPNAKELQSILDYKRSPASSQSAAIDPIFRATSITNEDGQPDFGWYWASTTHASFNGNGAGVYVAFGTAGGWQKQSQSSSCYVLQDVHGAGAQRSDPKTPGNLPVIGTACSGGTAYGMGPQGDSLRGTNFVRLVRNGAVPGEADAGPLPEAAPPQDGGPPPADGGAPGDGGMGPSSCDTQSDCDVPGACPSTLGCTCTQTPQGMACVPKCSKDSDCPKPPNQTLVCGPNGLCVPG